MSEPQADNSKRAYVCAFCSAVGLSMRYCSGCKTTMYCSRACQKKDWNRHQLICGQTSATDEASTSSATPTTSSTSTTTTSADQSNSTPTSTAANSSTTAEPTQALTFNGEENVDKQESGFFAGSNILLAGAVSLGVAVAGWFAYSYFTTQSRPQAPQQKGRQPPKRR